MEKKIDKKLDGLTRKLMKDLASEAPSFDFTTKVMSEVEVLSKSTVSEYKPLISKNAWVVLGISALGIFSLLLYGNLQFEDSWTLPDRLDSIKNFNALAFTDFAISNTIFYGIVGFSIFAGVQIFMLKQHFNKRLAI